MPKTVKKLYNSIVVLITNYILVIWALNASKLALYPLFQIQNLKTQIIIEVFQIVSLLVVEFEALIVFEALISYISVENISQIALQAKCALILENKVDYRAFK